MADISLYGADGMNAFERRELMTWHDEQKDRVFDNRRVMEDYCEDDVTVLREACTIFRRDFIEIGNIEVSSRHLLSQALAKKCCAKSL